MRFGWNLHRLRKIKGDTVADVVSALNISGESYISWESGEQEPCLEDLCLLARHFRLTIDTLVDETFDYSGYLCLLRARGLLE